MQIRNARMTDSREIARLSLQLGYEVSESHVEKQLEKLMQWKDRQVYVIEESESKIAGWVHVHGRHVIESHSYAEIEGLVVDNKHRRKGVGETLMRNCEEWARNKGYQDVRLRSGGQRKEAHEFYRRIGYQHVKWQEVFYRGVIRKGGVSWHIFSSHLLCLQSGFQYLKPL